MLHWKWNGVVCQALPGWVVEPFAIQKPGFSEEAGLLGPNVITPRSDCKFVGQAVLAETPYERHEAEFVSVLLLCGRHSLPYCSNYRSMSGKVAFNVFGVV